MGKRMGLWLLCGGLAGCAATADAPPAMRADAAPRDTHESLNAALWQQSSAEYRVDSQAKYRIAKSVLDQALADPDWTAALEQTQTATSGALPAPTALIMDLDETVLDNSPFQGQLVLDRAAYAPALWRAWVDSAAAAAVPGALDFIHYAESRGVTIFYVTNRGAAEEPGTRANLAKLGVALPQGVDTVLLKGEKPEWSSDKTSRRAEIAGRYRILMLVGDDLGDFLSGAKDSPENRVKSAGAHAGYFGERWVLLANPAYGSWESALYGHDFAKPDAEKLRLKFEQVRGFKD